MHSHAGEEEAFVAINAIDNVAAGVPCHGNAQCVGKELQANIPGYKHDITRRIRNN